MRSTASGAALFPNPTTGPALLQGVDKEADIAVYNAVGQLILQTTANATGEAPLALPTGLYLARTGGQTLRLNVR